MLCADAQLLLAGCSDKLPENPALAAPPGYRAFW
jgi:hypothetical protein